MLDETRYIKLKRIFMIQFLFFWLVCSSCWGGVPFFWVCFQWPCKFPTELSHSLDGYVIILTLYTWSFVCFALWLLHVWCYFGCCGIILAEKSSCTHFSVMLACFEYICFNCGGWSLTDYLNNFCTEGDGSKIFVSCIAFRDRVCEDIIEAYRLPPNTYADKCICLVSHAPNFRVLRNSLEEIFVLCFSSEGSW